MSIITKLIKASHSEIAIVVWGWYYQEKNFQKVVYKGDQTIGGILDDLYTEYNQDDLDKVISDKNLNENLIDNIVYEFIQSKIELGLLEMPMFKVSNTKTIDLDDYFINHKKTVRPIVSGEYEERSSSSEPKTEKKIIRVDESTHNKIEAISHKAYISKKDGSVICEIENEHKLGILIEHYGITEGFEKIQAIYNQNDSLSNIGFSPEKQKWIGWTNDRVLEFGVGDKVEKGMFPYNPTDSIDYIQDIQRLKFEGNFNLIGYEYIAILDEDKKIEKDRRIKMSIAPLNTHIIKEVAELNSCKKCEGAGHIRKDKWSLDTKECLACKGTGYKQNFTIEIVIECPELFGKGEWVAKTLEDAKQMVIDGLRNMTKYNEIDTIIYNTIADKVNKKSNNKKKK